MTSPLHLNDMRPNREAADENEAKSAATDERTFRFVHSENFSDLLETLGASLVVTTYQAGKLVTFRAREGRISMLLRSFGKAMGLAIAGNHMSIGTEFQIWSLFNSPEVAAKMKPLGQHDGCFLPRNSHVTGNIDVHEIAWGYERAQPVAVKAPPGQACPPIEHPRTSLSRSCGSSTRSFRVCAHSTRISVLSPAGSRLL